MSKPATERIPDHEVVIIGAGVCGIYMLYRMRELGVDVTLLEKGDGPGGTWYWNRYPGARFDSESYTYGYSFSKEILEEWNWSEHFAAQPETLSYLNFVVDKLGLTSHMQFGSSLESALFDDQENCWQLTLQDGRTLTTRFLLTAIGMLSAATMPRIQGVESFDGESFHTYYWPQEPVVLEGKKVAIIGTGATGVQVIGEIADKVAELTVFQRRPNWCAPLHNGSIDDETQARINASYDAIFERCRETTLYLYEFDAAAFHASDDIAAYYTAHESVRPIACSIIDDIFAVLRERNVELRLMPTLWTLREAVANSTLAFSIIRMRNAGPVPNGFVSAFGVPQPV